MNIEGWAQRAPEMLAGVIVRCARISEGSRRELLCPRRVHRRPASVDSGAIMLTFV